MTENMHPLFLRYGAAFDLANQAKLMSTPERGLSEFAAFCIIWPKVCALLDAPARVEFLFFDSDDWELVEWEGVNTIAQCIDFCAEVKILADNVVLRRRVVLLDGTLIRESGGS